MISHMQGLPIQQSNNYITSWRSWYFNVDTNTDCSSCILSSKIQSTQVSRFAISVPSFVPVPTYYCINMMPIRCIKHHTPLELYISAKLVRYRMPHVAHGHKPYHIPACLIPPSLVWYIPYHLIRYGMSRTIQFGMVCFVPSSSIYYGKP